MGKLDKIIEKYKTNEPTVKRLKKTYKLDLDSLENIFYAKENFYLTEEEKNPRIFNYSLNALCRTYLALNKDNEEFENFLTYVNENQARLRTKVDSNSTYSIPDAILTLAIIPYKHNLEKHGIGEIEDGSIEEILDASQTPFNEDDYSENSRP